MLSVAALFACLHAALPPQGEPPRPKLLLRFSAEVEFRVGDELATPAHRSRTLGVITADHGESLLDHAERLFSHDPGPWTSRRPGSTPSSCAA